MSHFSWFFKGTEELVPSRGSFAGPLTQFPEENGTKLLLKQLLQKQDLRPIAERIWIA
jgi:hypothetical protein